MMEEQLDSDQSDTAQFEPARFTSELGLPDGEPAQLKDAATAVRQEYRDSSRWKRLNCRKVSVFAERDRGTVYVIHVGKTVEFDWTWEGARAFCPNSLDDDRFSDVLDEEADYEEEVIWSGEILEVDEQNGCLFVALDDPEATPKSGSFFVRPFEFLSVLDAVYNGSEFEEIREQIPSRLNASEGDVHPAVSMSSIVGLSHLRGWWQHSWSVLWGPPGTGKTWTTGQQIARVLQDRRERILIVSTTNKATDAVALSLGEAAKEVCPKELQGDTLLRIGKGASYQTFVSRGLDSMLAGTESEVLSKIDGLAQQLQLCDSWEDKALTRKQIGELRTTGNDPSNRIFVDPDKRVVIATAFKAMTFLTDDTIRRMVEDGDAPFTTVIIDEAGLISRTVVGALSLLAARRVVLVGDSKQLAPISRISRVLPTRQQTWLASSGLSHLEETGIVPTAVHFLTQQRRMHPDVCNVVSSFQYNGILTTASDRVEQGSSLAPFIAETSRTIWYVLDEEDCDLDSIRASRGPGNKSWVRSITRVVLEKLFADPGFRNANGLFISPFKAQAQSVGKLLAESGMTKWEASTVHSQQGSEADIVIFDTVNAGSHTWGIVEWKRLVNVALSRAREAVIVLASRSEMEEPYLRPLRRHLKPAHLINVGHKSVWRELGQQNPAEKVAESKEKYRRKSSAKKNGNGKRRMGDQFGDRNRMTPVFSQEQQRLTNLELDGRPRLVRGVAGSGKSVVLCNWLAKTAKRLRGTKDARIWAVYANRSLHKLLCDSIESAWAHQHDGDLFGRSEFPWENVELLHVKDVLSGMLLSVQMSIESFGFDYDRAAEEFLNRKDASEILPRCSALFIDEAQDMGPSTLRLLLSVVEQSDGEDPNSRSAHIFFDNAQNVYGTKTPKWSEFGLDMRGRSTIMRESFRSTKPITELAVNILDRLSVEGECHDQQELLSLGLLKRVSRNGDEWLDVGFSQVDGPKPIYNGFATRSQEMASIAGHLRYLIEKDGISPTDICVIYNGRASGILESELAPKLAEIGVELSFQKNRSFERKQNTLVATTAASYKGYESEVVVIPCVDHFVAPEGKLLGNSLYVAMTRARSLLAIYGINGGSESSKRITGTIAACVETQNAQSMIDADED
ncbi:MAG: AAA domain-containing protein [Planctomycetota bacterium]